MFKSDRGNRYLRGGFDGEQEAAREEERFCRREIRPV